MSNEVFGRLNARDPRFLEKAAAEPSMFDYVKDVAGNFMQGLGSWPFDFMLCMHWIAGSAGVYGPVVKRTCDRHTDRILTVLQYSLQAAHYVMFKGMLIDLLRDEKARAEFKAVLVSSSGEQAERTFSDSLPTLASHTGKAAGRFVSGAALSAWMETRARASRLPTRGATWGIFGFTAIALAWGSAVNVSAANPQGFHIATLFAAWLTGDPKVDVGSGQYAQLFRVAKEVGEPAVAAGRDQHNFRSYTEAVRTIHQFGEKGGRDKRAPNSGKP